MNCLSQEPDTRDGIAYFVMTLVRGGSLADLLAREPRLPVMLDAAAEERSL